MRFGFGFHEGHGRRGRGGHFGPGFEGGREFGHEFGRHGGPRGFRGGRFAMAWGLEGEEGGGRRRRVFDGGELRLVLLKLIGDQPRHGYDLIRAIEELTGGAYAPSPGVVYPTVTLLQDMDLIAEAEAEGNRKAFAITEAGTAHLAERQAEVEALFARLAGLAEERGRPDVMAVRRAMHNLHVVLRHRLSRPDVTPETIHDAVALIDEVARKIERM
ncbi:PadR family transcriptional regulator [Edaphosphingomonas haloaromaticamans]|uniref:Transcriptional regulator YqjI n=1 Tax=Edaphosphingomonas haloaromaticamans TaxID=653954 RepID=A0A1S1HCD6_9SPHN|nr:PadR family transcriptional regulator [Sphingomonas haloaromaticamans]OHT19879.1 Transcriptional regulator YqjI [Sphingomonas haloaromaticamans]